MALCVRRICGKRDSFGGGEGGFVDTLLNTTLARLRRPYRLRQWLSPTTFGGEPTVAEEAGVVRTTADGEAARPDQLHMIPELLE